MKIGGWNAQVWAKYHCGADWCYDPGFNSGTDQAIEDLFGARKGIFLGGIKLVIRIMIIDQFMKIGVLRMTYYINHRNWNNLLGRQFEVKKVTWVNEKGHTPHPPGLHHQARPVSVTLHLLRSYIFIISDLQSFSGTYDVGVIRFWVHQTAEQHKHAIRNYGSC